MVVSIVIFSIIFSAFVVSLINLITAPVLRQTQLLSNNKKLVSVLIPARNEEKNISDCIEKILMQDYPSIEIIVLNDQSRDRTAEVLNRYNHNIKIVNGQPLPDNWLGKNWACEQLASKAKGDYFLFVDADVKLEKGAVTAAVSELEKSYSGLLTIFPTQKIKSPGEWLIVPLMNWLLLSFLALIAVYFSKNKRFVAANGQFMLWEKDIYFAVGRHEAVKTAVVEDMEFAKLVKKQGSKLRTLLGGSLIFCRMYSNLKESVAGFSKNFYPGFNLPPLLFLFIISALLLSFFFVFIILFYSSMLFWISAGLIILSRIFVSVISGQNILLNILLHPLQMLFMFYVGIISLFKTHSNKVVWKERLITK